MTTLLTVLLYRHRSEIVSVARYNLLNGIICAGDSIMGLSVLWRMTTVRFQSLCKVSSPYLKWFLRYACLN